MTRYGTEVETHYLDKNQSTVENVRTIRDFLVTTRFKRYSIRIKVKDKKDEMTQFLQFSDLIEEKRRDGVLFIVEEDPTTQPSFGIEYWRNLKDGSYYVVHRYAEVVL